MNGISLESFGSRAIRQVTLVAALWSGVGAAMPVALAQTTVRYTEVIRSIFYVPAYIADKNGYFTEQGLDVKIGTAWGADKAGSLLISGAVDIALIGPEAQIYIENSPSPDKTKIVCRLTAKDGSILVSRKKMSPAEFKWSMLKGKDFLDWRIGSTTQVDSAWVLKKHGIDVAKDLNDITSIAATTREAAWLGGKGDFATFFEPTVSLLERDGNAFAVASMGNEIGPLAFTVFMATDKYIAKNPQAVQGWCNAIQKAQTFVANSGPAELAKLVSPYFPQLDYGLLLNSIKRYQALGVWPLDVATEPADMVKMQNIMVDGGVLKPDQRVPFERLVIPTFATNARKSVH